MRLSFLSVVLYGQMLAYAAEHSAPGLLWGELGTDRVLRERPARAG